jgi:hypothetical protein
MDGNACDVLLLLLITDAAAVAALQKHMLCALLLLRKLMQARACLFDNLFIRFAAFLRFSCLDVAHRWRLVRRAAALLFKAAAAAASGELLPSCARISRILRRRKAPLLTLNLQMAFSHFIHLLPAANCCSS